MSDIEIRDARPDEFERAAEVMAKAYEQYYSADLPVELMDEYMKEIRDVRRRAPFSSLIVAVRDGEILGAVTYYDDATLSEHQGWPEGFAEMRLLGVSPAARGLGVGRLLAEETLRRARETGHAMIGLHTSRLMDVAQAMYERMGFVLAPEFDFAPSPDADITAIAYTLRL